MTGEQQQSQFGEPGENWPFAEILPGAGYAQIHHPDVIMTMGRWAELMAEQVVSRPPQKIQVTVSPTWKSGRHERAHVQGSGRIFVGGQRGDRVLVIPQGENEYAEAIRTRAAELFIDLEVVQALRFEERNGSLHLYAVVSTWDFDRLKAVYERELELREEFPDLSLDFKAVLEEEEDRIPASARLLMKR